MTPHSVFHLKPITARTFPVSGRFSGPQRDLYSAVLATQKQIIPFCSENAGHSQQELHQKSCKILKTELNQIGFNLVKEGDLERVLFPHYLSHHIGIGKPQDCYD